MDPIVKTVNLSVKLSGALVLEDISIEVERGDFVALMGPNGAGKTTLVRTILGFIPRSSGRIMLFGKDIEKFKENHRIGYIPQSVYFDKGFPISVLEVVSLGLVAKRGLLHGLTGSDRLNVIQAIEKVGLTGLENKHAAALSGGQQQRVLIARALVGQPDLLILDEPTASTDVAFRERFWEVLRKLNTEDMMTIILITHQADIKPPQNAKVALLNKRLVHYCGWDACRNSTECAALVGMRP